MNKFSIKTLAKTIGAASARNAEAAITSVSTDSRTVGPGECFFAIKGENFDGHDYVEDAFSKGAACAVVEKAKAEQFTHKTILAVDDTVKALGDFAREYRRTMNFKVVAITGSTGKTTTRQIITHVLSRHLRVKQSPKNFNNNIGLPLTILGANADDQVIIAELGSNSPGEISYLAGIAQPDIAVVTNIYPVHLAGFGNIETIVREKISISEGLSSGGVLIINSDFERLVEASRDINMRIITFGQSSQADITAHDIKHLGTASRFTIDGTHIFLSLPGKGNIDNALAAWAVCKQFDISIEDFAQALKGLSKVSMRAEILKVGNLTIINDCYNANPASMENALEILSELGKSRRRSQQGRLVFICGDMAELGPQTELLHADLGAAIAKANVKLLLAIGENAQITTEAAKKTGHDLETQCFENTNAACNNLSQFIKDTDIILIKGSRVNKLELAVEKLKQLFPQNVSIET
jgi:UDP-N-acetylmuramoyl-tripeptide--D-alanyl-D-alanine ligase